MSQNVSNCAMRLVAAEREPGCPADGPRATSSITTGASYPIFSGAVSAAG